MTSGERDDDRRTAELIMKSRRLREDIARTGSDVTGRLGGAQPALRAAAQALTRLEEGAPASEQRKTS